MSGDGKRNASIPTVFLYGKESQQLEDLLMEDTFAFIGGSKIASRSEFFEKFVKVSGQDLVFESGSESELMEPNSDSEEIQDSPKNSHKSPQQPNKQFKNSGRAEVNLNQPRP